MEEGIIAGGGIALLNASLNIKVDSKNEDIKHGAKIVQKALTAPIIKILDNPTVGQFADFLNISQSNATYKVNSLIKKGYLERQNSSTDRREYHLVLSEKYYRYENLLVSYRHTVAERMKERFSEEDQKKLDEMLRIVSDELMPECQ